jgi:predicted regulator of Ras-like GTPase activity (Roadblock/LC7/MglB family)
MGANLKMVLSSLRDVDGIVGSFVVNAEGDLVAQDLPAYFDGVVEQVAPRAIRLRDALSLSEGSVSNCTIRYADHKLSLRSVHGALLAVLANHTANAPALRMAMNLVARKCSPAELASAAYTTSPPAVTEAPPTVAQQAPSSAPMPQVSAPPPPPRAVVGAATLPSVPSPVTVPATPASRQQASEEPADGSTRRSRAVYFRGKRVE